MTTCIYSLFSGSSGNSYYVQADNARLLIDMGVSARAVCASLASLGVSPDTLNAVFVTHEHIDHVKGLNVFSKTHCVPVHIVAQSFAHLPFVPTEALRACAVLHEPLFEVAVNGVRVSSFPVSHDSAFAVGYRVTFPDGRVFSFATDTGFVTDAMENAMSGSFACVLEANHDKNMLYCGSYPYALKERILSRHGHLSNEDCAAFAARLEKNGARAIMLGHLSRENNYPPLAEKTVANALSGAARLCIAEPSEPVLLWEE